MKNEQKTIEKAKNSFNRALSNSLYNEILKDDAHLKNIIRSIKAKPGDNILDLGTGTGYIAFALAKMFPACKIIGLDLADEIIVNNNEKVTKERLNNLCFLSYDGISFPFGRNHFSNIVTRYALHHFPNINETFGELSKIVKPKGLFFISDPTPNEDDEYRIIDKYMNVKDDGHIKFYTKSEFESLLINHGFEAESCFYSEMCAAFPEKESYLQITSTVSERIRKSYDIKIIDNRVHLTLKILNISFIKNK